MGNEIESMLSFHETKENTFGFKVNFSTEELKTEEGYTADIVRTYTRHMSDICPGIYVRQIYFFGFQLRMENHLVDIDTFESEPLYLRI